MKTGHIGLNVTDLEHSQEFYRDILGFELIGESREPGRLYAFLGLNGEIILTLWQQSTGRFGVELPGLHHLSFQVESMDQVREAESKLHARNARIFNQGIVAHSEGAHSGGIFFEDPDGTRLEIFSATGAEKHEPVSSGAPACGFF